MLVMGMAQFGVKEFRGHMPGYYNQKIFAFGWPSLEAGEKYIKPEPGSPWIPVNYDF